MLISETPVGRRRAEPDETIAVLMPPVGEEVVQHRANPVDGVLRHKLVIAIYTIAIAAIGLGYAYVRPLAYTATTSLLISGKIANQSQFISLQGDIEVLEGQIRQLTTKMARVNAELQNREDVPFPAELKIVPPAEVKALLEQERLLLVAHSKAYEESITGLKREQMLYMNEAQSLSSQITLIETQQNSLDDEIRSARALAEHKLETDARVLDLGRLASDLALRKAQTETELLKAKQLASQADQRMQALTNQRHSDLLVERQTTETSLSEAESKLRTSRANLLAVAGNAEQMDVGKVANEMDVIKSDTILQRVMDELALDRDNRFLGSNNPDWRLPAAFYRLQWWRGADAIDDQRTTEETPDDKRVALRVLQDNLSVNHVGSGSRLDVSFTSGDPSLAALLVNVIAQTYLSYKNSDGRDLQDQAVDSQPNSAGAQPVMGSQVIKEGTVPLVSDPPGTKTILVVSVIFGMLLGIVHAYARELVADARNRMREYYELRLRDGIS